MSHTSARAEVICSCAPPEALLERMGPPMLRGMKLILASTSRYRRALLERLGLPFEALPPPFEELEAGEASDPAAMVLANARGKAASLAADHPGALIIGSDQAAVCEGNILGKPGSIARAVEQLLLLSGREHELLTAIAVLPAPEGTAETALVTHRLRIRALTRTEAEAYVQREMPLDCAGAYKAEGLGIALFEYLRGDDPTAIVGLPLAALSNLLRRFGVDPILRNDLT